MTWRPIMRTFGIAVAIATAVAASFVTGGPVSTAPVAAAENPPQGPRSVTRIMTVVLENTHYDDAMRQPFLKALARRGALLENFSAVAHPSLPNYIALIAGSTYGITSDDDVTLDKPHIGDLLDAKGVSWKVYAEGYPGGCFLEARDGDYARKHVPFLSFRNVQSDPARCARIVNASALKGDLDSGKLPRWSLYIPDQKNDGHDTGVAYADRWLADTFGPLLENPEFMRGMLFIVTFDEGHGYFNRYHVTTILVGDAVRPGAVSDAAYNTYSLLRLGEDVLGLGNLGAGDVQASAITGIWK